MTKRKFTRQYLWLSTYQSDIGDKGEHECRQRLFPDIPTLDEAFGLTNSQVGILVRAGLGQIVSLGDAGCVIVVEY